jgi:hypothetical protein
VTAIRLAAAIRELQVGVALATLVERPFEVEAADLLQAARALVEIKCVAAVPAGRQ